MSVLKGHGLAREGAPYGAVSRQPLNYQGVSGPGCAKCTCGAMSGELYTAAERKRWHRDHKALIRSMQDGAQ